MSAKWPITVEKVIYVTSRPAKWPIGSLRQLAHSGRCSSRTACFGATWLKKVRSLPLILPGCNQRFGNAHCLR